LISALKALAIYCPVSFERGAGAETGAEAGAKAIGAGAGIKAEAGAGAKIEAGITTDAEIKAAKSIFKDGFFLRLPERRVAAEKPRTRYYCKVNKCYA
jgi:hypothetical protein